MNHSFLIVESEELNGSKAVSIVPSGWFNSQSNTLFWPNRTVPLAWVKNNHPVQPGWMEYRARIIREFGKLL